MLTTGHTHVRPPTELHYHGSRHQGRRGHYLGYHSPSATACITNGGYEGIVGDRPKDAIVYLLTRVANVVMDWQGLNGGDIHSVQGLEGGRPATCNSTTVRKGRGDLILFGNRGVI